MAHRLHIAGLDSATTSEDLRTIFSNYGTLTECSVSRDKYGVSRQFGFVAYDSLEAARVLLDGTTGPIMIHGVEVDVMPAANKEEVEKKEEPVWSRQKKTNHKLFVGGLHGKTTNDTLKTAFLKFGAVNDAIAMLSREGEPRGFGFVTMKDATVAQTLVGMPMLIDGNSVEVKFADGLPRQSGGEPRFRRGWDNYPSYEGQSSYKRPRRDNECLESEYEAPTARSWYQDTSEPRRQPHRRKEGPSCSSELKVFVRQLPTTVNKERLQLLFSQFGDVKEADLKSDRGVGFVEYYDAESAQKAVTAGSLGIDGKLAEIYAYGAGREKPAWREENRPPFQREEANDRYTVPHRTALDRMQFSQAKQVAPVRTVEEPQREPEDDYKPSQRSRQSRDHYNHVPRSSACGGAKIFVGNVALEMTNEKFRQYWDEVVGDVVDSIIMPGRGFGFVTFNSKETADEVLSQTHVINGRDCNLVPADGAGRCRQPNLEEKKEESDKGKLFIGQLSYNVTKDEFTDAFLQFGPLVDVSCYPDRGFGFVQYEDKETAEYAMTQEVWFHGKKARIGPCEIPMRNKK